MAVLNRAGLPAKPKQKTEDVELESIGGAARLRALSVGEALSFRAEMGGGAGKEPTQEEQTDQTTRMIVRLWVDESGESFWGEDEEAGKQYLLALPAGEFAALQRAVLRLAGVSAEAIQEAEKN